MNKRILFAAAMAVMAIAPPLQAEDKPLRQAQDRPNIIFIMADDLGN